MIVIPTYNEAENIAELVRRLRAVLPNEKIFFVDDNSPDGTARQIKTLQQIDSNILLLSRAKKCGLASAYLQAFKQVLSEYPNERHIITMDADLSHHPEDLPKIISVLQSGEADVAVGSRYIGSAKIEHWNFPRKIISAIGNIYSRMLTGIEILDSTSGFVGYSATALQKIDFDEIATRGYAFQINIKNQLKKVGTVFLEVPITFSKRNPGQSKSKFTLRIFAEGFVLPVKILCARLFNRHTILPWLIFVLSFGVYFYTAPRAIFFGDNAEFITAVKTLGIAHPPGYPLYILLAKLFSIIPIGNFILRVNLFSAFCASLGLVIFYKILLSILQTLDIFVPTVSARTTRIFAASSALALAFSSEFWFQAIVAKPYALNFLIVLLLVRCYQKFTATNRMKYLYLIGLFLGLGIANHQMILLFAPIFTSAIYLQIREQKITNFSAAFLKALVFFGLGLAFYLYLPLRSHFQPALNWGNTSAGLKEFWQQVSRGGYHDFAKQFDWRDKRIFIGDFFGKVFTQASFLVVLAFFGIVHLVKHKKILLFLIGLFIANSFLIILLRSVPFSQEASAYFLPYYLICYATVFFLAPLGATFIFSFFNSKTASVGMIVLALIASAYFLKINFPANNLRDFTFLQKFSAAALNNLEPNAVLLFSYADAAEDSALFALAYQKYVQNFRPDVQIVAYIDVFAQDDPKTVNKIYSQPDINARRQQLLDYALGAYPKRPIYTTYLWHKGDYSVISNGLIYRIIDRRDNATDIFGSSLSLSDNDLRIMQHNFFAKDFLKNYYYAQAAREIYHGRREASQDYFIRAIKMDNSVETAQQKEYAAYRNSLEVQNVQKQ